MRVIAGTARRMNLVSPEGTEIRPTIDRHKEMVFSSIQHHLFGNTFLDLFSGSGAIGIEALSRGARKAIFVDNSDKGAQCILTNLNHTKLIDKSELLKYDYSRALAKLEERGESFEFIYLDPPYNNGFEAKAIILIDSLKLLNESGTLICESSADTDFTFANELDYLTITKEKVYKTSKFTYFKYKSVVL